MLGLTGLVVVAVGAEADDGADEEVETVGEVCDLFDDSSQAD